MSQQIQSVQTFADSGANQLVNAARLNSHVNDAQLTNGSVIDQAERTVPLAGDWVLLGDSTAVDTGVPLKAKLSNLLLESQRNGSQQFVGTDSGTTNTYVVGLTPAATAYSGGMKVVFKAGNTNTGASTVNVNGLGAVAIKTRAGGDLAANDILAGQVVEVVYDGSAYFQMQAAISAAEVTPAHSLESYRNQSHVYAADTTNTNTYAIALGTPSTAASAGMTLRFKVSHANTGAVTLAVDSRAAVAVKKIVAGASADLAANDIQVGDIVTVVYDGSVYQFLGRTRSFDYKAQAGATIAAGITDFSHGLGSTTVPSNVRVVLVCTTAQSPFAVNDELDVANVNLSTGDPYINWWVDASNGKIRVAIYGNSSLVAVSGSGTRITLTAGSWTLKVYASI